MQPLVPLRKAVCNFTFPSTETVWHCALLRCLLSRVWTRESKNLVYFSGKKKGERVAFKNTKPIWQALYRGDKWKSCRWRHQAQSAMQKQQGGLEMNPITTYCSRGDSHPAAATPAVFVWSITSGKCQKKKKKNPWCKLANIKSEQDGSFYSPLKWSMQSHCEVFFVSLWMSKTRKEINWYLFVGCFSILSVCFRRFWIVSEKQHTKQKSIGGHRGLCKRQLINIRPWIELQ